jgi:hypothetical protein
MKQNCRAVLAIVLPVVLAIGAFGTCRSEASDEAGTIQRVTVKVLSVSELPVFESGAFTAWVVIVGVDSKSEVSPYFFPYLGKKFALPNVSSSCAISFHDGGVSGVVGRVPIENTIVRGRIVDSAECDS